MPSLTVNSITKRFDEHVVVSNVSFGVTVHEVVALAGGNGAGKSTLLKIIAGTVVQDSGSVQWEEALLSPGKSQQRRTLGIEMVFQDCALCPDVSVVDNLFLGREPVTSLGFLRIEQMRKEALRMITAYRLPIPSLDVAVRQLSGGQQKAVAIGRALLSAPKLLLLDEPTAALGVKEQRIVLDTIRELRTNGVGIMLCTHSPDEIMTVADRVIVLRHGELVAERAVHGITRADLALLMST